MPLELDTHRPGAFANIGDFIAKLRQIQHLLDIAQTVRPLGVVFARDRPVRSALAAALGSSVEEIPARAAPVTPLAAPTSLAALPSLAALSRLCLRLPLRLIRTLPGLALSATLSRLLTLLTRLRSLAGLVLSTALTWLICLSALGSLPPLRPRLRTGLSLSPLLLVLRRRRRRILFVARLLSLARLPPALCGLR